MNNPPWLAILEAHSQAHEAWWFAFGLKEKRIMTPLPDRNEVWADIERTLRGVIDDGLSAELDELDASLLLELVVHRRSQSAPPAEAGAERRRQIIEECARVCDAQAREPECPERAEYCAAAIRALCQTADPSHAQKRIDLLRTALIQIAYSRWSTEPPGQFVEVLQKMARDALIANASARRAKDSAS